MQRKTLSLFLAHDGDRRLCPTFVAEQLPIVSISIEIILDVMRSYRKNLYKQKYDRCRNKKAPRMARSSSENPTELELLILKILWEQSPQTARQIRDALAIGGRDLAHTSVITTLQKMVDKQQLNQLDPVEGKAFRFEPRVSDQQVSRGMLGDIVDRVFDGSAEAVMLSLFDVAELDDEALKSLRKAFNQKLKEKSNE
jgi:BlaI family penicillinase repressor